MEDSNENTFGIILDSSVYNYFEKIDDYTFSYNGTNGGDSFTYAIINGMKLELVYNSIGIQDGDLILFHSNVKYSENMPHMLWICNTDGLRVSVVEVDGGYAAVSVQSLHIQDTEYEM